jgi:DNA-directed RNA polymerase subunit L
MLNIAKINMELINNEIEIGDSRMEFKISGPNIDYIVVNTIRRTIMSDVPIYAFGDFKFEKNTSIFHNNFLKLRFRHMPVWGIENDMEYLDNSKQDINNKPSADADNIIEEDEIVNDADEVQLDVDKNLNSSTLKQLTMYVNSKNKTNEIISVTTNDAKFYYNEKQIPSPYKHHIPLIKLQSAQEIAFSAITNIGTEQEDTMYSAVSICTYKQINDHEFNFIVESRGQINEKRIIQVALVNIERRLRNFLKLFEERKSENNNKIEIDIDQISGEIIVNNEDHTLGNLISRGMQMHEHIEFAGYNLPHPLVKKVHFHYKLNKNVNIKNVLSDVVDYYLHIFAQIKKLVNEQL